MSTADEVTSETLDELMSRDPLELTDQDLDKIIAYHRKQRAMAEAGVKVPKPKHSGPGLADILGIKPKADVPAIKRRPV